MLTEFRTTDDLWNAVNAQLGYDLELGIRNWLEKTGYVSAVLTAVLPTPAFGHLLQAAREAQLMIDAVLEDRRRVREGSSRKVTDPERYISSFPDSHAINEEDERRDLLGLLIAKRIKQSEQVRQFRSRFFPFHLLDRAEVPDWIYDEAPDGIPRYMVFRALGLIADDEHDYVFKSSDMYYHDLLVSPMNELSPEDRLEQVGGDDTALGQLVLLAMEIAEQTGWAYPETVCFLVTGERPTLPVVRAFPTKLFSDSGPRILMEIALDAAPEDVRTAYKLQRDSVYPRKRSKPLDEKTSAFVKFVLGLEGVDPDRPEDWQSIVTRWNNMAQVKENSWQIEADERRRISNTYKRAISTIETFSGGFDQEQAERLRRIAETEKALAAEFNRIYGDPLEEAYEEYSSYPEVRYDDDGIPF